MAATTDFLFDILTVSDLQALRDISQEERRSNEIRFVDVISQASPLYNLRRVPYQFVSASSEAELAPAIITPSDGVGRWFMIINPFHVHIPSGNNGAPTNPPLLPNMSWISLADTPARRLIWRSRDPFPDTPVVTDWVPDNAPISTDILVDTVPTFNADWDNQLVQSNTTNLIFKAVNLTGKWALESNDFVPGTNVTGDYSIEENQNKFTRTLVANAVITLTAALEKDIEIRIIKSGFTLTLAPSGTTINGGSSNVVVTEDVITLFNQGNNYFYF